jgi:ribosomal protein L37E
MLTTCPHCDSTADDDYLEYCASCGYVPPHGAD